MIGLGHGVFEPLFGAYPDGLLLVDAAGIVRLANPAACALLGYSARQLQGMPVDRLVPLRARERHADLRSGYAKSPRARAMGTQSELAALRRDGSEVMVEIALSPLVHARKPWVVAALRGIGAYPRVQQAIKRGRYGEVMARVATLATHARDAQVLLQRGVEACSQALQVTRSVLFLLEPDGRHLRVAAGVGLLGMAMPGDLLANDNSHPAGALLAQGHAHQLEAPDRLLVRLGDATRPSGVLAMLASAAAPFGDEELRFVQSMAGLLATCLQRLQAEEQLHHAQRLDSVGQLTGGIAHDFNNLLTVILGNLQVLDERAAAAGASAETVMLAAATRAAKRGADLTARLLAFSRRQILQPTQVDVGPLLSGLASMLRRTLDARVTITCEVPEPAVGCRADLGQLEAALLNLAINARDAMPDGGTLSLSARALPAMPPAVAAEAPGCDAGPCVALRVADTGSGMSDAIKARAFEPFFTTKASGRGTGLGLSTVYGFARQSLGAAVIESEPGQGTAVTLYLPRWRDAVDEAASSVASAQLPAGLRVLLVEDDDDVRQVVLGMLQGFGADVLACRDAADAQPHLADTGIALLLSDISLGPGERGTDLAARARALRPSLPVLLMTGYAADALDTGDSWPVLRKPFDRAALLTALNEVLAARGPV